MLSDRRRKGDLVGTGATKHSAKDGATHKAGTHDMIWHGNKRLAGGCLALALPRAARRPQEDEGHATDGEGADQVVGPMPGAAGGRGIG